MDTEVAVLEPGETFTDAVIVPTVFPPSSEDADALARLDSALAVLHQTLDELSRISSGIVRRSVFKELPNLANDVRLAAIDVSRIGQPVRVTAPTPEGEPVKRRGRPKKAE